MASLFAVAASVFVIDQVSKAALMRPPARYCHTCSGWLVFTPTRNPSPPAARSACARRALCVLGALAAVCLVRLGGPFEQAPAIAGLGAAVGGAAGNLADYERLAGVRDFLDVGLGAFNLADVGIVLGVAVSLISPLLAR